MDLFEKKRYTEARIYIDQAMKSGGDSSQVIVEHCGDIYYMLGEKDKALEYWKKADSMENKEEDGATPRTEAELKRLKRKIALKNTLQNETVDSLVIYCVPRGSGFFL